MTFPPGQPQALEGPLRSATPAIWVKTALSDTLALLNDHAHLERKAASNALELLSRWPFRVDLREEEPEHPGADRWSRKLASIARDEVLHLGQVLRLLVGSGGHFERSHTSPYAGALRALVRRGLAMSELVDRLLVSALIEARSCERFKLLAEHAEDETLCRFYGSLVASEEGHYRAFLELARLLPSPRESVDERWEELLDAEARIIVSMPPGPAVHSGVVEAPAESDGA